MKKVLLTSLLVLVVIFVFAGAAEHFTPELKNAKQVTNGTKDSLAIAAGAIGLFEINGSFGILPSAMPNMAFDTISGYVQLAAGHATGTGQFSVNYTVSSDGGGLWTPLVDLFPSNWSDSRSLSSMAISVDGYPYVSGVWRTPSTRGSFFTTDDLGPNGGSWRSIALISDTVSYTNYQTIAVNSLGDKVAFLGWNDYWAYGINSSNDFGGTWLNNTPNYDEFNPDSNPNMFVSDISTIRWGADDDVYCLFGFCPTEDAASYGTTFGLSKSTDAGVSYGAIAPIFNGNWWPEVPSISGDTMYYIIDTIANGMPDTLIVKAWVDKALGYWVDDQGILDAKGYYQGSWWHFWDFEYSDGMLMASLPYYDVTIDYVVDGDIYTFIDNWTSIMFGRMDVGSGETEFIWNYLDLHTPVLDTFGNIGTFRGVAFSTQLCYDNRNGDMYIVYMDLYDTTTGAGSHELIKFDGDSVYRATTPPVLNSGVSNAIEAPIYLDGSIIHTVFRASSADSVYYIGVDVDAVPEWEVLTGIEEGRNNTITNNVSFFNVPSIVRNNSEISFSISEAGNVKIVLYDVTGREIKSLVNGNFNAGTHSVALDGNTMTQGIYFAKIITNTISDSKKIIIVK